MGKYPLTLFILLAAVLVYLYLSGRPRRGIVIGGPLTPLGPVDPGGAVKIPPDGGYGYGGKQAYDEWQEYLRTHPNPFPKYGNYQER